MLQRIRRIAGLAGLLASVATAFVYEGSQARLDRRYALPPPAVSAERDVASLVRGEHLVAAIAQCTTCHGDDLGGREIVDDFWLGRLHASNLTPGRGGIAGRSDAELVRSIRNGIRPDGRPLLMMPSHFLHRLSDPDLDAIIAFLRSVPPVDRELPPRRVGPLARLALVLGRAPDLIPAELIDHAALPGVPDAAAPAPSYGAYLVDAGGCRVCHRADLAGGLHPLSLAGEPPPPNLTPGGRLAGWSEADFLRALRTGVTAEGRRLDPTYMPWPVTARMSDPELRAIWSYLRSLPAHPDPT